MLIYPVFLPNWGCSNQCVYCDQTAISATDGFDRASLLSNLKAFEERNRGQEKQIAFYGGSFTGISEQWRSKLLRELLEYCDPETSFRISTSPDLISSHHLEWCKEHRIKTIELGVQDFTEAVLLASGRIYNSELAFEASDMVQASGFELGIQLMPGLPGWTLESLEYNCNSLIRVSPQYLRLYPTIVIRNTKLATLYQQGLYQALTMDDAIAQCADYMLLAKAHNITVIKIGLPSTIASTEIVAGPYHPAFGEFVHSELLIRELAKRYHAGLPLEVEPDKRSLLMGHGKKYMKILEKRLDSCNINIIFAERTE